MTKPDLKFIEIDVDEIERQAIALVEQSLGRSLAISDPIFLLIKSLLAIILNLLTLIEFCARMNLLAFASGAYLDALGSLVGCERIPATAAQTRSRRHDADS